VREEKSMYQALLGLPLGLAVMGTQGKVVNMCARQRNEDSGRDVVYVGVGVL
jgi:hypothetical protein